MSSWQPYGGSKINEDRFFEWCSEHIEHFRIESVKEHRGRGKCPFHNDKRPSLITWSNTGYFVCLGRCNQRLTYSEFCRKLGVPIDKSVYLKQYQKGERTAKAGKDIVYYTYVNEFGEALIRNCITKEGTHFYQHYNGTGWANGTNGIRPIYNKHGLTIADPASVCIVVEGEKDAENLVQLGFLATTTPFGASYDLTKFRAEFVHILRFKQIVIMPDNDPPGNHYKDSVISLLQSLGGDEILSKIAVINIAQIAGVETEGFDISDYIDLLRTSDRDPKKEIEQLLAQLL